MQTITALGAALAKLPASPTALAPRWLMHGFSKLSHPTPDNSWLSLAVIEGGAVIPGRSIAAWRRDPLDFRERIFDEVAVAVMWLWGNSWMQNGFDWLRKRLLPQTHALDLSIETKPPTGVSRLELTALERYAGRNPNPLMAWRAGKTLFGTLASGAVIAIAIPRVNQWLTERILGWEAKRQHQHAASQHQAKLQPPPFNGLAKTQDPGWTSSGSAATANGPFMRGVPTLPTATSLHPPSGTSPFLRFGGAAPSAASALQNFAHAMEWIQTSDYGRILSNDGLMITGRTYSAATRKDTPPDKSRLEALEILVRDVGSNYFYFLAQPHVMGLLGRLFQHFHQGTIALDPLVAQDVTRHLGQSPQLHTFQGTALPLDALHEALYGLKTPPPAPLQRALATGMAETSKSAFLSLLAKEGRWTLGAETWDKHVQPALARWLTTFPADAPSLHSTQVVQLLDKLHDASDEFQGLSVPQRRLLQTSIKQAFRHHGGVSLGTLQNQPAWMAWHNALTTGQQAALAQRLEAAAEAHRLDRLASAMQRLASIGRETLGPQHPALAALQTHLAPLEQTVVSGVPWPLARQNGLQQALGPFIAALDAAPQAPKAAKTLAQTYQRVALNTLTQPPVLFSLQDTPAALAKEAGWLLSGGLKDNPLFLRSALNRVGLLPKDHKTTLPPAKRAAMQQALAEYLDTLWQHAQQAAKGQGVLPVETLAHTLQDVAVWRNMMPRYVSHGAGILFAMAGLGLLIPNLQYWITKKLTGEYQHPALIALRRRYGLAETPG